MKNSIIKMYVEDMMTIVCISKKLGISRHVVRNVLLDHNITISSKGRYRRSEEQKRYLSSIKKGKPSKNKGRKVTSKILLYKNMQTHLKYDVSIEWLMQFDLEKIKVLNKMIFTGRLGFDTEKYILYIERFYKDANFNKVYNIWLNSDKDNLAFPSLDHKTARSRKGDNSLDNLQVLTNFENRAKAEMSFEEWEYFKKITNLKSKYIL